MSRIGKAYESRLRALLLGMGARRVEQGVEQLVRKARERSQREDVPLVVALRESCERLRDQARTGRNRGRLECGSLDANSNPRFFCDAGLGGLARWLRAAGYEALWVPDIEDAELLRRAREVEAVVLTTDSLMMERGVLRDGEIPAFWLPPAGSSLDQLTTVLREFRLPIRDPYCMSCGGELAVVEKESVRDRIPPKTWKWINRYYLCARCGKLFWRGTHWQKIQNALAGLTPAKTAG